MGTHRSTVRSVFTLESSYKSPSKHEFLLNGHETVESCKIYVMICHKMTEFTEMIIVKTQILRWIWRSLTILRLARNQVEIVILAGTHLRLGQISSWPLPFYSKLCK